MVDINSLKTEKKNCEGASWVNFEMTVTGRERRGEQEKERKREREREREKERGRY
jgi:hypothetical protein